MSLIDKISVRAGYCFGENPAEFEDLGAVNFIFAANGSGKTTVSRALSRQPLRAEERRAWDVAPTLLPIRVFNEDYKNRVLVEHMNGIFTVGEDSAEVNAKISELLDERDELSRRRAALVQTLGAEADFSGQFAARKNAREALEGRFGGSSKK